MTLKSAIYDKSILEQEVKNRKSSDKLQEGLIRLKNKEL